MAPLTAAVLERRLDAMLNPVLSSRRTAAPLAQGIAPLDRTQQDFTLHWVEIIARTNYEMAYQFAAAAPAALAALDADAAEAWIIHAMDSYDRAGLYQGSDVFRHSAAFATQRAQAQAVRFEDVAAVLELFVCGLAGRRLRIETAAAAWTDTEALYLPPRIAACLRREDNFLLYKIIATLLWAQTRYGTFNADLDAAAKQHAEPERALAWLGYFETLRMEAQIARVLPGLSRDMRALTGDDTAAPQDARFARLREPTASVDDSIALLDSASLAADPPPRAWRSALHPAQATTTRDARIAREKDELQAALAALLGDQPQAGNDGDSESDAFELEVKQDGEAQPRYELSFGGQPLAPPQPVRNLLDSILQDLGEIPDDYLKPSAAPGDAQAGDEDAEPAGAPAGSEPIYYDEWDYQRRHYRKQWCALREVDIAAGDSAFVDATLKKYAPQVAQLKRTFELLRGEDRLLKRMKSGDDIDLDAVIEGYAELRTGRELNERLFIKRHKAERSLAVMFMVDMSGSTKGWINEAEREALVLLAEALEVLGDRYAIYGFSGITRKRCEIFHIKGFDEPYSDRVRQRIAGIAPQDYTRMGAAIRHLTARFAGVDARTRLLITLSDGKPDDYSDHYRGDYGIEDTRQALIEAHRAGIKPFCITIDSEARDYLPHMYGAVNWTRVDDVSRLPLKVAEIYRRLTT